MADRAIELLNKKLKILNTSSGEYLKIVGDSSKSTSLAGIAKINDINTGAISNVLEYTRQFHVFLVEQLDLRETRDTWLDYIGENFYNIQRRAGESDGDYSLRIITTTAAIKCTPLAIQNMLGDYGDNVVLSEDDDGAFANLSFANVYRNYTGPTESITKASIAGDTKGLIFFFRITMENVSVDNYSIILNLINNYRAAGIAFIVEIN